MITFYRTSNCPGCQAIQEALEDLAMVHKVVVVPQGVVSEIPVLDAAKPPILVDDDKVVQGNGNILAYLEELKGFKELWYKYQSDTCYCD